MLRGLSTNPRPSSYGPGADIDSPVHGEFGRHNDLTTGSSTTPLTFEPSEETTAAPYLPATRLRNAAFTDEQPAPQQLLQHRRQNTAPSLPRPRTAQREGSPLRRHQRHQSDMPFTGDGRVGRKQDAIPVRQEALVIDTTPKALSKGTTAAPQTASPGFFGALKARWTNASSAQIDYDELANMDIETALLPPESLSGREAFSPAAYKNLQMNAIGLCTKMQTAFRQRTMALEELQAEREADKEEAEEAKLRVESLKMQLELMAQKADEQQQALQRLMAELNHEKKARQEERLVQVAGASMVNDDLGYEADRKQWRKSGGTIRSEVSGFDTESIHSVESESVFSRSRSPTIMTSATESHYDLASGASSMYQGRVPAPGLPSRQKPNREMSTLQKLMKNIAGDSAKDEDKGDGCRNCRGQDSSMAWDTVSLLRDENKGLKHRIGELEVAVEGALDLVNGVGQA
ncbi:hypothetical protein PFICI_11850 [Pestalotiopsis fici W106-1]|uniref:Uncharacterized protein n=1 Tax=Pestalotiopsis fici (strain W106-1 / CGMCC3.15140) TaxID=1229662 RepID=W3WRI2_PESFW|nr:uncharacterized protein PFICI_11850 [Pestalotiopsis fici W106-1]ETS76463.1 hypothetical protein PFICI_11850 [Pestalotiopsis fici W106-1]